MKPIKKIRKRLEARRHARDILVADLSRRSGSSPNIEKAFRRPGSNKK